MALVKRSNSEYWYVQFQIDHHTIIKSTKTTDRRIAREIETRMRSDVHAGKFLGKKQSITFEQAMDRFIQSKTGLVNHRNLLGHKRYLLKCFRCGDPLRLVTSERLSNLTLKMFNEGLSAQTIKHRLNLVMGTIRLARRDGYETSDAYPPVIKLPNGKNRFLSREEELRLLKELDPLRQGNGLCKPNKQSPERFRNQQDNYDLIVLLLDTGARYGEIAGIGWDQINLDDRTIMLWRSKVNNESVLFMSDRVEEILSRRKLERTSRYVFSNKNGGPRGHSNIAIRKAFNRAGLHDCTIHTLRHTHASRLVQLGMSIYEVQKILGHSDIRTTMRYAHLEETAVSCRARDLINSLNQQTG